MSAETRDFSSFYLGDDVFKLAGEVIPEIADRMGVSLSEAPSSEELGQLVGAIGKNKVLRNNEEVQAIGLDTAVDLVERSGVQSRLSRSLQKPADSGMPSRFDATVLTGAVANWQDRSANIILNGEAEGIAEQKVYIPIGNRVMDSPTEVVNPNVAGFMRAFETAPTESQYGELFVAPLLERAGVSVELIPYDTANGDEIAERFVADHPELFTSENPWDVLSGPIHRQVSFARVANAGIQLAVQFRKAALAVNPEFDKSPRPQVYVRTDTFPLARTSEQIKDSRHFQSPFTALRQVALTAKLLHEAAGRQ